MSNQRSDASGSSRGGIWFAGRWLALSMAAAGLLALGAAAASTGSPDVAVPAPSTPREFFNAGVKKLRDGKLPEAESLFESALASQEERWQPPALYNLGQVRFQRGVEELKKGPQAEPVLEGSRAAMREASVA